CPERKPWWAWGCFFFSSRRRHTRFSRDWSSDVCSSDLQPNIIPVIIILLDDPLLVEHARRKEIFMVILSSRNSDVMGCLNAVPRSEERRVGKECRSRRPPCR